jgi:hypothetical protein
MRRDDIPRIGLVIMLATSVVACDRAAAAPTGGRTMVPNSTVEPTAQPTPAPTEKIPPPNETAPTTDVPDGFRVTDTAARGLGLVAHGVQLDGNFDTRVLTRWDATSLELLGSRPVGEEGAFPPDLQSMAAGSDGVWVTLASEHAVGLMDPRTGKFTRKIIITGYPYDVVEVEDELWIADFGWSQITRYDLSSDEVVKTILVGSPTDVIFADGAIWAPVHVGRGLEGGPLTPGGNVARIDMGTNEVAAQILVGPRPYYMASGFGAVWTGTATGASVDRVDTSTNEVTTIWVGEDGAFDIEVIGDSVWAVVGPQYPNDRVCDPETSFFVRIDPETRAVRERVAFPCAGSIVPDGDGFWVAGHDGTSPVLRHFEPDE